ncbi:MAG: hypothetical protein PHY16_10155 [Methylobacter sp.]|nr:hypothetical protein [Methylobacter sp.]
MNSYLNRGSPFDRSFLAWVVWMADRVGGYGRVVRDGRKMEIGR